MGPIRRISTSNHVDGIVALTFIVGMTGCQSQGTAPDAPLPDPAKSTARAFELLDANDDGLISADELATSPGLRLGATRIDTGGDGNISPEELEAYFIAFDEAGALLVALYGIQVTYDGQPLVGATVTLNPEPFLEGQIKSAQGVTDANGYCELKAEGFNYDGVQIGFYGVSISMQDESGQEKIPTKYNTDTDIGIEVSKAAVELEDGVIWKLYSR